MGLKAGDITSGERPRTRRFVSVIAVIVPIIILAGAAAWFIRAYVMPPMITISERPMISPADATPATASPLQLAAPAPETTGASPPTPNWSAPALPARAASVWDSVPLPSPPRQMQSLAAAPAVAPSESITAPIPLPPPRPRVFGADFDLPAVPLPRPRPLTSN